MSVRPSGIAAPMVTPLRDDGAVCEDSVRKLLATFAGNVSILLPALSSGEGWRLSDPQWEMLLAAVIRHANGMSVYPGVMRGNFGDVLKKADLARNMGAAGITVPIPWGDTRSADAATEYFHALAARCPLPVFAYNTGKIDSEERMAALREICGIGNVVAIKESSRQPGVIAKLLEMERRCAVFQGWEDCCLASEGADGYAMALVNIESGLCARMLEEPGNERQAALNERCEQHRLFDDDWYVHLKSELRRRGVLSSSRIVSELPTALSSCGELNDLEQ